MNIKLYISIMFLFNVSSLFSMSHEKLEVRCAQTWMQYQAANARLIQIQESTEGRRRILEYRRTYNTCTGDNELKTLFPEESEAEKAAREEYFSTEIPSMKVFYQKQAQIKDK